MFENIVRLKARKMRALNVTYWGCHQCQRMYCEITGCSKTGKKKPQQFDYRKYTIILGKIIWMYL